MRFILRQLLQKPRCQSTAAFTLLELLTSVVVIAILATMIFGVMSTMRGKADYGNCTGNLRALYGGVTTYMIEKGNWPQISTKEFGKPGYAREWIKALEPYSITRKTWACPSVQRAYGNPDLYKEQNTRIDYFATPFDNRQHAAWEFPTQPWFIERGSMHGEGNLMIFANGQTKSLKQVVRDSPTAISQ